MAFLLKAYRVSVDGYGPVDYEAASPGKARAKAWRDFTSLWNVSFRDFLSRSTVRRLADPPGFGDEIVVSGKRAYRCLGNHGQYVRFVRDDSDIVLLSHPMDVETAARHGVPA